MTIAFENLSKMFHYVPSNLGNTMLAFGSILIPNTYANIKKI